MTSVFGVAPGLAASAQAKGLPMLELIVLMGIGVATLILNLILVLRL